MQMPFQDSYHNQAIHPPNNFQWRPNFAPRGPHMRPPRPHWRPPPQEFSNEYWCETCDRGFRTADILESHKQQHQKCNIDGCQFIAHPKVITKHIQMQHASGLYKKIAKLQDPEEIKKWRDERKKKYPTKENVEKAAAAVKEKIERGEKMGLKNNRHERNPKTGNVGNRKPYEENQRNQRNQNPRFNQNAPNKRKKFIPKPNDKKLPAVEDNRKLKPFGGIQELDMDVDEHQEELECGFTIEDEEDAPEVAPTLTETAVSGSVCLALSSLQCDYGSSDEEECEKVKAVPIQKTEKSTPVIKKDPPNLIPQNNHKSDDEGGPEEVKVAKGIINEPNTMESKPINKRKAKDDIPKKVFKRPKPKLPSTLLHKLLFKEMRHERNIVLQCVRHIVKNNFFDKSDVVK